MIYELASGQRIDTNRELSFEERNFVQKLVIYEYLGFSLTEFQKRWRKDGNPIWRGEETLKNPTPAVKIILDLERKIKAKAP